MHPFEQAWNVLKAVMIVYGVMLGLKVLRYSYLYWAYEAAR